MHAKRYENHLGFWPVELTKKITFMKKQLLI